MNRPILLATFLLAAFLLPALLLEGPARAQPQTRPTLPVLTGLPLFWGQGGVDAVLQPLAVRSPLLREIGAKHQVEAVDTFDADHFRARQLLLAIQPASLPAEELVALDAWVRRGGRALIFADPDLIWPTDLAVGDRRRAPVSTLLDPLFGHWGVALAGHRAPVHIVLGKIANIRVKLVNPGVWHAKSDACVVRNRGLEAICTLGLGQVILVADADMLDPRLWAEGAPDNARALQALLARLEMGQATKAGQGINGTPR